MAEYTAEDFERAASSVQRLFHSPVENYADMLRFAAATLRQQAGRVDEGMVDAVAKAIADVIGHGMREKCYAHADAVLAALAQNTQGSHIPPHAQKVGDDTYAWQGDAQNTQGAAGAVLSGSCTHGVDLNAPCRECAERARVPEAALRLIEDAAASYKVPSHLTPSKAEYVKAAARNFIAHLNAHIAAAPSQRAEVSNG